MRTRSQAGFTLVEMVVSTSVFMVVMLFALQMLGEAGRLHTSAQIELAEPSLDLATRWLRRDTQGATHFSTAGPEIPNKPLYLLGNDEGTIRYEKVGSNLDRVILGIEDEEIGRRTVMRGVLDWRWRALSPGLVEVQLVHQRRVVSATAGPGNGSGPWVEWESTAETRRFALRGVPRSSW